MSTSFLQIEPTTRCNFHCIYCCGRSMTQEQISPCVFEAILRDFPSLKHVQLQGEGEPLLHPQFLELVEALCNRGIGVSFITNGSLLEPGLSRRLVSLGVCNVNISLDTGDPEEFRRIRRSSFVVVARGIRSLVAAKRERQSSTPAVGMCVTLLRSSHSQLEDLCRLYEGLGMDGGIGIQFLQTMPYYAERYCPELLPEMMTRVKQRQFMLSLPKRVARLARRFVQSDGFYKSMGERSGGGCPWLERGGYISAAGRFTACVLIKDATRFGLGKVGADSAQRIEAAREEMRLQFSHGLAPPACSGCSLAAGLRIARN